jgi:hypothetical protein
VPLGLTNVAAIAGKGYHSVALKSDGTIAAWGRNGDSQLDAPVGLNLSTDAVWKNPDGGQFLAMYNWEGDTPSTSGSRAVFTLPETYSVEFTTDSRAKAILATRVSRHYRSQTVRSIQRGKASSAMLPADKGMSRLVPQVRGMWDPICGSAAKGRAVSTFLV